jgi:hypothetical protein
MTNAGNVLIVLEAMKVQGVSIPNLILWNHLESYEDELKKGIPRTFDRLVRDSVELPWDQHAHDTQRDAVYDALTARGLYGDEDYWAGYDQGQDDARGGVMLGDADQVAAWENANEQWKEGWSNGYERG